MISSFSPPTDRRAAAEFVSALPSSVTISTLPAIGLTGPMLMANRWSHHPGRRHPGR